MTDEIKKRLATFAAILFLVLAPDAAQAQLEGETITLVVPFPPGGSTDIIARMMQPALQEALGARILVDNRPGASTAIGTQSVAGSAPDGHTLLFTAATTFTTNPAVLPDLTYSFEQFEPVAMVVDIPFAFVIRADFPAQDVASFQAYAKANAGSVNNATNGLGSTVHVLGEIVARGLGIKVEQVHYTGAAPAMNDLIGGHVDSNVEALANAVPSHEQGLYRAIAVLAPERVEQLPDVPTFAELGFPSVVGNSWFAIFAPAGTPEPILDHLNRAISEVATSSSITTQIEAMGNRPFVMGRAELGDYVRSEAQRLGGIIRETGIRAE